MRVLITRDRSSGRIHKRFQATEDGPLASFEGCNADDAGDFEFLEAVPESADTDDLCTRCFPSEMEEIAMKRTDDPTETTGVLDDDVVPPDELEPVPPADPDEDDEVPADPEADEAEE